MTIIFWIVTDEGVYKADYGLRTLDAARRKARYLTSLSGIRQVTIRQDGNEEIYGKNGKIVYKESS